jgi:DNA-binding transcriptional MerR regulator
MAKGNFIGEVSKQTALSVKAIRYYEGLGLLSEPDRTESGYRVYAQADVERLRFIKGAKSLGLSLHEIKEILAVWGTGATPCRHVERLLADKVAELDRRIRELTTFRDALTRYMAQVAEQDLDPEVPCRHIEGASTGRWTLTPPEQDLVEEKKGR